MADNGKVLLSGGASRNYGSTLAQKLNSSSIAEFGTSAPLAAIQCYRQLNFSQMKKMFKKRKEVFRIISFIPLAALVPIFPINIFLLGIQLFCFGIMFWVGWSFD